MKDRHIETNKLSKVFFDLAPIHNANVYKDSFEQPYYFIHDPNNYNRAMMVKLLDPESFANRHKDRPLRKLPEAKYRVALRNHEQACQHFIKEGYVVNIECYENDEQIYAYIGTPSQLYLLQVTHSND